MLTAQKLLRAEVWTLPQCAGGTRKAILARATRFQATTQLNGDDVLDGSIALQDAAVPELREHRIIRVDDGTRFDEWVISKLRKTTTQVDFTALPLANLLGGKALVSQTDGLGVVRYNFDLVGLKPSEIIDNYLLPAMTAAGYGWFARGTIDVDVPTDITLNWDTPLSVLKTLADRQGLEFQLRRNGTAGYYIDLLNSIGSAAGIVDVRYGKNLLTHEQQRSIDQQVTRVFPRGMDEGGYRATMARASWKVSAIAGGVLGLVDPAGGDGPIMFDSQLVGCYLRKPDGSLTQVTASSASAQSVTVASSTGLVLNDLVQFRLDATGKDLTYMWSPADQATDAGVQVQVLDLADIPGTNNVIPNPALRNWTSGSVATGWTQVGVLTSIAKQVAAPYVKTAGASAHIQSPGDGIGLLSPSGRIFPSAAQPYVCGYATLWVVSGQVRAELVFTTGSGTKIVPLPPIYAKTSVLGQWVDIGIENIDANALGATAVQIRVLAHGGAAEFYLDSAQVTEGPGQKAFVEGSGGTRLWQSANERLRLYAGVFVSEAVNAVDLYRLNGSTYADTKIDLGAKIRVTDARLSGVYLTRIVQFTRDYLVPGATTVVLSTRPEDLTGALGRPARPSRLAAGTTGVQQGPGPSLKVDPVKTWDRITVNYTVTAEDAWMVVDNGARQALPATGFQVMRNAAGGALSTVVIHALQNGQETTVPVDVPAQDAAPPTCWITELASSRTKSVAVLQLRGLVGAGSQTPLSWRYRLDGGTPTAWSTASISASNLSVTRAIYYDIEVFLEVQQPDGQSANYAYTVMARYDSTDETSGKLRRAFPFDDNDYGWRATSSDGYTGAASNVDSTNRQVRRAYAKASYTDGDTADYLVDGSSRRVPLLTHLNAAGQLLGQVGDQPAQLLAKTRGAFFAETWDTAPGSAGNPWSVSSAPSLVANAGSTMGPNIIRFANGFNSLSCGINLSFNPNKLYRMRARVRNAVANTSGSSLWYVGLTQYDASGTVINNTNGGVAYICAAGGSPTLGVWTEYVGWFRGATTSLTVFPSFASQDPTSPTPLNVGCTIVRPLIYAGYNGSGGTFELDYVLIDEYDEDGTTRTYSALDTFNGSYGRTLPSTRDSTLREVRRSLAKANYTDGDTYDYVPEGSSYNRILATAVTSGQVDFSKAGVINRIAAYMKRSAGGANVDTIINNLADTGHLGALMQDNTTREVRRNYAKSSYTDGDTADYLVDGSSRRVPLLAHLNASGTLLSKVDAGASIDGLLAKGISRGAQGKFFSETFETLPSDWVVQVAGTLSLQYGGTLVGKSVLQSVGEDWRFFGYASGSAYVGLPFNIGKLYRIRARYRQTVNPTVAGNSGFYVGIKCLDGGGTNLGDVYVGVDGPQATVAGGWIETTGWFKGASGFSTHKSTNPLTPVPLFAGTTQIVPMYIMNYPTGGGTGNGTAQLDYIQIDEVDEDLSARGYSVADVYNGFYGRTLDTTRDSTLREIRRAYAKVNFSDGDTADYLIDGSSRRVPLLLHLNASGVLLSKVGQSATINGIDAGQLSRKGGAVFVETFDADPTSNGWLASSVTPFPTSSSSSTMGPNLCDWPTGFGALTWQRPIPFNPNKLYRIRARYRTSINNTSGSSLWYVGLQLYDNTGALIANANSGVAYICAAGDTTPVGSFKEAIGWFQGATLPLTSYPNAPSTDPTAPAALNVGTVSIAPLIYAGYNGSGGTFLMDYLLIDEFDEDGSIRTYSGLTGGGDVKRQYSGATGVRSIVRGGRSGVCKHGDTVTFPAMAGSFAVAMKGGISYTPESKWGTAAQVDAGTASSAPTSGKAQYKELEALNPTSTSFLCRGRLRTKSTPTANNYDFTSGNTTSVVGGDTGNVTLAAGPSSNGQYTVTFDVTVTSNGTDTRGYTRSVLLTVAIDVDDGSGTFVERRTLDYGADSDINIGSVTNTFNNETYTVTVTVTGTSGRIRIRAKSFTNNGIRGTSSFTLHGHTSSDTGHGVVYYTASGDQFASATPDTDDAQAISYVLVET